MKNKKPDKYRQKLAQEQTKYSSLFLPSILLLTAIVFFKTLFNDFADNWDDNGYILNNERMRDLTWSNLRSIFSSFFESNYHPLTLLTNVIEYRFFGLNPFYFHFFNYCLHLFNTALVYLFIRRLTKKTIVAAITTLFFAIHPMHVESVAWISERKDVLYSFFFLLSLNSYCKYLDIGKRNSFLWSFFWFFLSLLSKSAAVCLPIVLVLIDFYFLKKIDLKTVLFKMHFFILSLIFLGITLISQHIEEPGTQFGFFDRILLVFYSTGFYLWKAFLPFGLCALHFYPLKSEGLLPLIYYFAPVLIGILIWGVFKAGKFKRELVFGLSFYLITILMVLQIVPIGRAIVSERYSYVPYIGVFFIVGQFFAYLEEGKFQFDKNAKNRLVFLSLIFAVSFSIVSYQRIKVWKNGVTLFSDVVEKHPQAAFGWHALGEGKVYAGDNAGALVAYSEAIRLDSSDFLAYMNRGVLYMFINKTNESLDDFHRSIALNPGFAENYYNRGNLYYGLKKYKKAIIDYSIAVRLKPDHIKAHYNRAVVKYDLQDKPGACADWLIAKQLGDPGADEALNTYCK